MYLSKRKAGTRIETAEQGKEEEKRRRDGSFPTRHKVARRTSHKRNRLQSTKLSRERPAVVRFRTLSLLLHNDSGSPLQNHNHTYKDEEQHAAPRCRENTQHEPSSGPVVAKSNEQEQDKTVGIDEEKQRLNRSNNVRVQAKIVAKDTRMLEADRLYIWSALFIQRFAYTHHTRRIRFVVVLQHKLVSIAQPQVNLQATHMRDGISAQSNLDDRVIRYALQTCD